MSISERYRQLVSDVVATVRQLEEQGAPQRALTVLRNGKQVLEEQLESVGEIPRINIEYQLSPVLLNAHNLLDRGRLLLIEGGADAFAPQIWVFQQMLYRLLNDL